MRFDVYTPLPLSVLLAAISPAIGRRVAPAPAARVLTAAAVVTAAATCWSLFLLAATLLGDAPPVVAKARQDGHRLAEPVPEVIGIVACIALSVLVVSVQGTVCTDRRTRRALRRLSEGHRTVTELIVAASPSRRRSPSPVGQAGSWSPSAC